MSQQPHNILYAEDDPDDVLLMQMAHSASKIANPITYVKDGRDALDYVHGTGPYDGVPLPGIIVLDMQMPRVNGLAALRQLKEDPLYRRIPVIMMTTSTSIEDVNGAYAAGASAYIVKPPTFGALVAVLEGVARFWFHASSLPRAATL